MKIKKFYRISGLIWGITLGLLSLILTIPTFAIFLLSDSPGGINLVIGGPLVIFIIVTLICYLIGSKIGGKSQNDLQNLGKQEKRAKVVLLVSLLLLLLGSIVFLMGIYRLFLVYKSSIENGAKIMQTGIEREKAYEQYATIGDVKVEPQGSTTFLNAIDGKMTEVSLFKKLVFAIPISVSHAGTYEIYVKYNSNSNFYANSDSPSNVRQVLGVGDHLIKVELVAGKASNLGYESPNSVQGKASIQLDYLASKKELLDSLESDGTVSQKILQQFMKDEGLDQGVSPNSTVNKFVERKEIQF